LVALSTCFFPEVVKVLDVRLDLLRARRLFLRQGDAAALRPWCRRRATGLDAFVMYAYLMLSNRRR